LKSDKGPWRDPDILKVNFYLIFAVVFHPVHVPRTWGIVKHYGRSEHLRFMYVADFV
jgi:hypothetical protein